MSFNCIIRLSCFAAVLAVILLAALPISGKSGRAPGSKTAKSSPNSATSFDLSDFGAVGNGVADDGPALQRALDALAAARGGTLFVPAGRYLLATPVAKDFSGLGATVIIQGVPSSTLPAPPSASGQQLSAGLNLTSEIIPATGANHIAINLSNLHHFTIEHISFAGRPEQVTDALISLYLGEIDEAIVRHCEFYAVSSMGGGNIIRAVRSGMSIELTVFLGCTANSGVYAPVVENIEWRSFKISNSIFIDYGQRAFFGKMHLGAPLSWINMGNAAAPTPASPRREFVVRDTFLDEGGWIGITGFPYRFPATGPIDLVYISGLKMNVSNLATAGHNLYDAKNILIENSHYGWSHNALAAIELNRIGGHAILDNLTCIDHADRLYADNLTQRLTVINSDYQHLDSQAQITTVIDTPPENDPVQYVRRQFVSVTGKQPDPAAHFYWSDLLIKCGQNNECLDGQRTALNQFLTTLPKPEFSISGLISDKNGVPISGVKVSLTGSQSIVALTDSQGIFRFSNLPTSGIYTVAVNNEFTPSSKMLVHPTDNVTVDFRALSNGHAISGRITRIDGTGASGIEVKLGQSASASVTTDVNGHYLFSNLPAGQDYTVVPFSTDVVFTPENATFANLSANREANFVSKQRPQLLTIEGSEIAVALDAVNFTTQPFSIFDLLRFANDGVTRVLVFGKNLDLVNSPSQISVTAEDDQGVTYPLVVESITELAGHSGLKQLNVKLSPDLPSGQCLRFRLSVFDVLSNNGRICLAPSR